MRCFLALMILLCSVQGSFAQEDSSTALPDQRILFQSKVRQLVSYLNEGNESKARIIYKDVANDMEDFLEATRMITDTASGAQKKAAKEKFDNQQQLYRQYKAFWPDIIRNRESIDRWTDLFVKTLF